MTKNLKKEIFITIDLEDIGNDYFRHLMGRNSDVDNTVYVHRSIDRLVEALEPKVTGCKFTFFVTGDFVQRYGAVVKSLKEYGHEISCHYHYHDYFNRDDVYIAEKRLCNAIDLIHKHTGDYPLGFRAPRFSLTTSDLAHIALLEKYFVYDSSIIITNNDEFKKLSGLTEAMKFIPLKAKTILPGLNLKAGGSYMKVFPNKIWSLPLYDDQIDLVNQVYIHPYELLFAQNFQLDWQKVQIPTLQKLQGLFGYYHRTKLMNWMWRTRLQYLRKKFTLSSKTLAETLYD